MELTCNIESREAQRAELLAVIREMRGVSFEDQLITYGFLLGRQSAQAPDKQQDAS